MAEYTCKSENCCRVFDEDEKKITNDEDKCILHCEKNDWYDDRLGIRAWINNEKTIFFWEQITDYVDKITDLYNTLSELADMKRKDNEELYEYKFYEVKFPLNRDENFLYSLNDELNQSENKHLNLIFDNCDFLGDINFKNIFKAKNITFRNSNFYENTILINQKFDNTFLFENCTVHKDIIFQNIKFMNVTSFIGTTFNGNVNFIHTKFYDLALFNDCKIAKIKFENTFFREESNFLNLKNEVNKKLESKNIDNRETARIIKDSFERQNNTIEANKYYAIEMKEREKELEKTKKNNPFEWLVFKIHGISSNHSQDWLLALGWIIVVGMIASMNSLNVDIGFTILLISFTRLYEYIGKYMFIVLYLMWFLLMKSFCFDTMEMLNLFSNYINPFSIMTKGESLTLGVLIFKVIIAYLIYQFIVSIRQNTRRK